MVDAEVSRGDKGVITAEFDVLGPSEGALEVEGFGCGGVSDVGDQETFTGELDEETVILDTRELHIAGAGGLGEFLGEGILGEIEDRKGIAAIVPFDLVFLHVVPVAGGVEIEAVTIGDHVFELPAQEATGGLKDGPLGVLALLKQVKAEDRLVLVVGVVAVFNLAEDVGLIVGQELDFAVVCPCFAEATGEVDLARGSPTIGSACPTLCIITEDGEALVVLVTGADLLTIGDVEGVVVHRDEAHVLTVGVGGDGGFLVSGFCGIGEVQRQEQLLAGAALVIVLEEDGGDTRSGADETTGAVVVGIPVRIESETHIKPAAIEVIVGIEGAGDHGRSGQNGLEGIREVVEDEFGFVVIVLGITFAVGFAGILVVAEENEVIFPTDHALDLADGEGGQDVGIVDVGGTDLFDAEFVVIVVRLAEINLFDEVFSKAIDGADIGGQLKGREQARAVEVGQIDQGEVGIGEVQHHPLVEGLVFEDDGALYATFGVFHRGDVFENILLFFIFGVVVLGQIPAHDTDGAFVFRIPPAIGAVLGVVADGEGDQVDVFVRIHTEHLVSLIEVPVEFGMDPLCAFDGDALALNEADFVQIAHIHDANGDVGATSILVKARTSRRSIASDAHQEIAGAIGKAEDVHIAAESVNSGEDFEIFGISKADCIEGVGVDGGDGIHHAAVFVVCAATNGFVGFAEVKGMEDDGVAAVGDIDGYKGITDDALGVAVVAVAFPLVALEDAVVGAFFGGIVVHIGLFELVAHVAAIFKTGMELDRALGIADIDDIDLHRLPVFVLAAFAPVGGATVAIVGGFVVIPLFANEEGVGSCGEGDIAKVGRLAVLGSVVFPVFAGGGFFEQVELLNHRDVAGVCNVERINGDLFFAF